MKDQFVLSRKQGNSHFIVVIKNDNLFDTLIFNPTYLHETYLHVHMYLSE